MKHPADELLERFARTRATRGENREVVLHLLQGCRTCSQRVASELETAKSGLSPRPPYTDSLEGQPAALALA